MPATTSSTACAVNTAAHTPDRPMPGLSQAKYPIPIQAKYAAASAQISGEVHRRASHAASPTIATAAAYHAICIGQAVVSARPNAARN